MRESIEKQKNAWIYRSLIRNLLTVTYNFVLYYNGTKFNGITDTNYQTWNYSKNTMKIVNEAPSNNKLLIKRDILPVLLSSSIIDLFMIFLLWYTTQVNST